ncbi:MAG TPA: hypothetical protein VKY57_10025 [Chitinispirillaceae bacterium]|nr:hypothetical protein [Chitinispirillaceae bacterium]
MKRSFTTLFILTIIPAIANACLGPQNVFGILLNDCESVDISVIEEYGELGTNYFFEYSGYNNADSLNCTKIYSFKSHYNPAVMVQIFFPNDQNKYPNVLLFTINKEEFAKGNFLFSECIRKELNWLVNFGILSMERIKREKIETAFIESDNNKTASFFWTKQDTLLPNNTVFDSDGQIVATACDSNDLWEVSLPPEEFTITVSVMNKYPDSKKYNLAKQNILPKNPVLLVDIRGCINPRLTNKAGRQQRATGVFLEYDTRTKTVKRILSIP